MPAPEKDAPLEKRTKQLEDRVAALEASIVILKELAERITTERVEKAK